MDLSDSVKHAMRLCRKDQDASGWCKASKPVMQHIIPLVPEDLMDRETNQDGSGQVRLTDRGNVIADYL